MSGAKTFEVRLIGFDERERRILRSMAALSTSRPRRYAFRDAGMQTPDFYLVDRDDPNAVASWTSLTATDPAPAAVVAAQRPEDGGRWWLSKPIVPSRLFALLDQMTVEELHFLPELHIGQEQSAATTTVEMKTEATTAAGRALVVDDSPTLRKQMELGLRVMRVAVDFAETGEQALQLFAANRYDIVFLDVMLPGIDGYQVCRTMKKDKLRKHTPVVMLTGKSSTFDRVKGSLAGCDTYLTKPVEHAVFQAVLAKYLKPAQSILSAHRPAVAPATR